MSARLEAKEIKVGRLFSEQFIFKIPIYQRPLSWSEDNFGKLIEDVCDAIENNDKQYFLGSIILQRLDDITYEVVDGQQRLTALAILLAVLRDAIDDAGDKSTIQSYVYQKEDRFRKIPEIMRIVPWEELENLFKTYIYTRDGTKRLLEDFENEKVRYVDKQDPTYHLYEAVNTYYKYIPKIDLENFLTYLLNSLYLVYIKTSSLTSAFRLFTVLNTRGLQLTAADILKSENLGLISDEKRIDYAKKWRQLEDDLGRKELAEVIGFVRTIKAKEKARLSMYEEYRKLFDKNLIGKGTAFFDLIEKMARIYERKVLNRDIELKDSLKQNRYKLIVDLMKRFIPFSDWIPPLMAFDYRFRRGNLLADFLFKLENKVLVEWAAGFTPTERITSMSRVIKSIDKAGAPEDVLSKLVKPSTEADATDAMSRFIDFTNKEKVDQILTEKLDDTRFYSLHGGKFAKYVLLRIDMEMWDIENFPGYPGTITVEHILPRTPEENSEWIKKFDKKEREEWTNKLGNLVLLSGRKNSAARNYDFKTKKDKYFKRKSTPFMITRKIDQYKEWNIKNLTERHNELIGTFKRIYSKS